MFKVKRNYGNGFEVEVEANKMTDLIAKLAAADEVFLDVRCAAMIDGNLEVSDRVKFSVRNATTREGRPCKYYEQICVGPKKLAWYKRQMGVYQDSELGALFVKTKTEEDSNSTPGLAGWSKYNGSGGDYHRNDSHSGNGNGNSRPSYNRDNQQYGQPQPQPQYQQKQQTRQAPQPDLEDIPF